MDRPNTFIFLSDLVRAIRDLGATGDDTVRDIIELLGFLERQATPVAPRGNIVPPTTPPPGSDTGALTTKVAPPPAPKGGEAITPTITRTPDWEHSTIEASLETSAPALLVPPLPPLSASEESADRPPLEPLFEPNWTRSILSTALATHSDDGPLDLHRLVDTMARAEPVRQLPRLHRPTLRRGVQVLVDRSQAMIPYARDQAELQEEIRAVVGKENCQVLRFVGCPLRGAGTGPKKSWYSTPAGVYRVPPPGTVVLLLTDLGIGGPVFEHDSADVLEWLEFATPLRQAGYCLIAFVPYTASRCPRRLTDAITVIQWDRRTTPAVVYGVVCRTRKGEA